MAQGRTNIKISAGIIRRGKQLRDLNLNAKQQDLVKTMLPQAWKRSAINSDRFDALRIANREFDKKFAAMPEDMAHVVLEMDGGLQLLKLDELAALEGKGLDEADLIEQLTP